MSTKKPAKPAAKKPASKPKSKKAPEHPDVFQETHAPHKFTPEERERMGNELRTNLDNIEELEGQAKSAAQDFKLRIQNHKNDVKSLRTKLGTGEESRPVRARVTFDAAKGVKTLWHPETGEMIRTDPMQPADHQLPMFKPAGDGKEVVAPKGDTDVPTKAEAQPAKKKKGAKTEPADNAGKTPMGAALNAATGATEAPKIDLYFEAIDDESKLVGAFKKAATAAGWSNAQISTLNDALKDCDSVSAMKDVLRPHIVDNPSEQPAE